jgi:hypothetical protein
MQSPRSKRREEEEEEMRKTIHEGQDRIPYYKLTAYSCSRNKKFIYKMLVGNPRRKKSHGYY